MTIPGLTIDETAINISGEWPWLHAAIDLGSRLILDMALFRQYGVDTSAASLYGLRKKHGLPDAVFLVNQFGYRTALSRLGLNSRVNYAHRNPIEKWFHTLNMRIDQLHNSWVGSRASAREWLVQFVHHYNRQRPHQSLNGQAPAEAVLY